MLRITLLALLTCYSILSRAETFTVGIVPQFEPQELYQKWAPLLKEISEHTGDKYILEISPSIPSFEVKFSQGAYDFVYLNPWHAIIANETQGYLPLLKSGARQLSGILVVAKNSDIQSVADLNHADIAFPAPNALGASLLMRTELKTLHNLDIMPRYVNTHPSSYLNALLGQAQAAGGVMRTFKEQPTIIQDNLRIIYTTRKTAPHPIMAHPRTPAKAIENFKQAIIAIANNEKTQPLLKAIPMENPVNTSMADYLVLKDWGLQEIYANP